MAIINHIRVSMISVSPSESLTTGWTYKDLYYIDRKTQGVKTPDWQFDRVDRHYHDERKIFICDVGKCGCKIKKVMVMMMTVMMTTIGFMGHM